jgi:uracil DNA glycosylase
MVEGKLFDESSSLVLSSPHPSPLSQAFKEAGSQPDKQSESKRKKRKKVG